MRRSALGVILLVFVPVLAVGQVATTGLMVGPDAPIVVDIDADGIPEPTDTRIVPTFDGQETVVIPNPWEECGPATHNVFEMQSAYSPGGSRFVGGTRTREGQVESLSANELLGDRIIGFAMNVDKTVGTDLNGEADMIDENDDLIYDALAGSGDGGIDFLLDLVFADTTGDGYGDYVSIPWSQASALGVATEDECEVAGGDPQVFVPMADTTGDGIPDSIVLDLDGNGVPDPEFLRSAIIGPAVVGSADHKIPTLSQWSVLLATLALAAVAWMQLRSSGLGA